MPNFKKIQELYQEFTFEAVCRSTSIIKGNGTGSKHSAVSETESIAGEALSVFDNSFKFLEEYGDARLALIKRIIEKKDAPEHQCYTDADGYCKICRKRMDG